ncbi:MAG TPA: nucleotide disphospho-sugar-binding domain-containing protein [Parafilimonas sp.]|nr:nucleotide disphospho-sugar-binding domain-containing protein [Parafilimonas sp.]
MMEDIQKMEVVQTDLFAKTRKKILFANFPADGHFNPLTGLAVHLKNLGHDVRWYTSNTYAAKLKKLNIMHYRFKTALEVTGDNLDEVFPERSKIKGQVKKLVFDMINAFIFRGPQYFDDICEIREEFDFNIMISDCAFSGIPFVKEKLGIPVISIGVLPLTETSKDLPPSGLGMTPVRSFFGRWKQSLLRFVADNILFSKPTSVMNSILREYHINPEGSNVFDILIRKASLLLQSGTPGFEYTRSDLGTNIRFIGPLLPYRADKGHDVWTHEKLSQYEKIILVTQGTVEKDVSKLLVPTLEAFKNSKYLVVATTGGSETEELRKKYPYENIIIEDFIPFSDIMPYADVYITNGGYGGVMLSIQNQLPMVVAGIHEGKNEINARIGYFDLGINLKTERPAGAQLRTAVEKVLSDDKYYDNVKKLSKEFSKYNPNQLLESYIDEVLQAETTASTSAKMCVAQKGL